MYNIIIIIKTFPELFRAEKCWTVILILIWKKELHYTIHEKHTLHKISQINFADIKHTVSNIQLRSIGQKLHQILYISLLIHAHSYTCILLLHSIIN